MAVPDSYKEFQMEYKTYLSSKPHDGYYLTRYINLIERFIKKDVLEGENHHILPRSSDMFPEFSSFIDHPWNKVRLPLKYHFYAHYLLHKAYPHSIKQTEAFCLMGGRLKNKGLLFLCKLYEEGVRKRTMMNKGKRKGMVSAKDIKTGKSVVVTKEIFHSSDNLVGIMKDRLTGRDNVSKRDEVRKKISKKKKNQMNVKDKKGKVFAIDKNDFDPNIHETHSGLKGRENIIIVDQNGVRYSVSKDDGRITQNKCIMRGSRYLIKVRFFDGNECLLLNKTSIKMFFEYYNEKHPSAKKTKGTHYTKRTHFDYIRVPVDVFFNRIYECFDMSLLLSSELQVE